MKTVNLLPRWYMELKRQRRHLRLQIVLLAVLIVLMAGWVLAGRQQVKRLQAQRDELTQRATMVRNLTGNLQKSRAELQRLEDLKLAYQELGNTVPMSTVVQQVLNDLTPGMALSHVTIDVIPEAMKVAATANTDARHPTKFHNVAHLGVVGVAPNDVLIAQLIGKLSANPLFSDVALNYSRTEVLRACMVRRFEIQMRMEVDRLSAAPDGSQTASAGDTHNGS